MPDKPTSSPASVTDKIDEIILILDRMNRRDRLRTIGGTIRSILALIPMVLVLWSAWYFVQHGPELMKTIADQAAKSAAVYTQKQGGGMLDEFMKQYAPKK
jgi:hypothetical protein